MTTESSRFDVIADRILHLQKQFQEETKAHRAEVRAELKEHRAELKEHRAEAKLHSRAIEVLLTRMDKRDAETATHRRAIEVLLEEVLAQRNGRTENRG